MKMLEGFTTPAFQNQLWTVFSGLAWTAYNHVLVLVAAWTLGVHWVGLLGLAIAVVDPLRTLAVFGVRTYQATDVNQMNSFTDYLWLRIFTCTVVSLLLVGILHFVGYGLQMATVIALFFFINLTNAFTDVFFGHLQQRGLMRVAGRVFTAASILSIAGFSLLAFFTGELRIALVGAGIVQFLVCIGSIWVLRRHFGAIRKKPDFLAIKHLLTDVFYLVLSMFVLTLTVSVVRILLEFFTDIETLGVFVVLSMPAYFLSMFSSFFFAGAESTRLADVYASGNMEAFGLRVKMHAGIVGVASVPFIVLSYLIGIPLLGTVYNMDLVDYRTELMLLVFGGSFIALSSVLWHAMIVMRKQRQGMYCYLLVATATLPVIAVFVSEFDLLGASLTNLVFFAPVTLALFVTLVLKMKKEAINA